MALVSVTEKEFSSRGMTLDLLRKRVAGFKNGNKQNVAVIGRKHIGKSTLLLKFFYELSELQGITPVYLELRQEPFQLLERRFLDAVVEPFRAEYGEDFDEVFPERHPDFCEKISKISRSSRMSQEQALSSMFGLLADLQKETGRPVVFILDEFQELSGFRIKNPYSMLGEKIMTQKEVMYLVSSSTIKKAKDILDNDLSLLFGNFEVHEIGSFSSGEARVFADKHLPGFSMPRELLSFLLSIADNNPFYLESILGDAQRAACLRGGPEIRDDILSAAVANQLHNPAASIHQFFLRKMEDSLDFRSAQDFEILLAVADGSKKSPQIAKTVSKSSSQTTRKLEKFICADILLKHGQVYDYSDPLMKLWMRSVYKQRCFSFKPVQDAAARERTRNHVRDMYSSFLFFHGMDTGERLRRLFALFENDVIDLAGRSMKFPKFTSVGMKTKSGAQIPVLGSVGRRSSWALDYAEGPASESDITGFLEKLQRFPKTGTRVFLCLDGIEADAKLLAKEKEIWLWTIHDLNILCGVYEQPGIMSKEKWNG